MVTLIPLARRAVRRAFTLARRGPPASALDEPKAGRDSAIVDGLRKWIADQKPDVLWLGFGGISYDLIPLKQQTGAPVLVETECVWSRFILRELPFESDPQRRERIRAVGRAKEEEERLGALQADLTTAVSEVDAEYFRSIAAAR